MCNVSFFSGCFEDFLFTTGFQQFGYDAPGCGSVSIYPA